MQRRLTIWAAGLALLTAVLLPAVFHTQLGAAQPGTPPSPRPAAASPDPQRHPRIEAALHHLEEAKRELEAAPDEFHGHRVRAIGHVNQALEECRKALESAR